MTEKTEWKEIGVVHTDSGRLMIADPALVVDELWNDKHYEKYCIEDNSIYVQVPDTDAVIAYCWKDDLIFKVYAKFVTHENDDEPTIEEIRIVAGDYSVVPKAGEDFDGLEIYVDEVDDDGGQLTI